MQYQRKRNFIYQKEIKNIHNFRINHPNLSKTNDSTREEEVKYTKDLHPIKISEISTKKYNIQNNKEIIKKAQFIEEKKLIKLNWEIHNTSTYDNNSNERTINNKIISLRIKNKSNNNLNNNMSHFSYKNISHNSSMRDISSKEDYKTDTFESIKNLKYNNYKTNYSNYIKYKSGPKKNIKKQINNYCYNNYNNYNYSNRKMPNKENISFENEYNTKDYESEIPKINYSNKNKLKQNRTFDINSVNDFPIQKKKNGYKYDTLTYNDLKKISKKFNKIYEIDKSDIIIKDTKIIFPGESNEINNNKKKILSKINRLSNILLANNKNEKNKIQNYINNSFLNKKINENSSKSNSSKKFIKKDIAKLRFYYISIFLKNNYLKKDYLSFLKINNIDSNNDLLKPKFNRNEYKNINREKSAKIIQNWWRLYRLIFMNILKQIIYIQCCWRGYFIRKNMLNKIYTKYLYESFCLKIKIVLVKIIVNNAFKKISLYNYKYQYIIRDNYNKIITIISNIFLRKKNYYTKEFWDKFSYNKNDKRIYRGKNLVKIKKNQEKKIKLLYSAFIKWAYKAKIKIINNTELENNFIKNNIKIKSNNNKNEIKNKDYNSIKFIQQLNTKYLIEKKSNIQINLIKKYFYHWYIITLNYKQKLTLNQNNKTINYIKLLLFIIINEKVIIEHNNKLLRLFFQKTNKLYIIKKIKDNKIIIKKKILKNIENAKEGYKILENYIFRNTYAHPLYCFMDKINNENIDINLMKILRKKKKNQKELLKDLFYIWKSKINLEKKNDIIKTLFIKIMNIYHKNLTRKILLKKLYQWKSYCIKTKSLINYKSIFYIFNYIKNINIRINSKVFFNIIKCHKNRISVNDLKILKKIILYINRKNNCYIIKKYFKKWNEYIIKYGIVILKGRIIYNIYFRYNINNYKYILKKYFYHWVNNTLIGYKNKDKRNIKKSVYFEESISQIKNILLKSIFRNLNRNYIRNNLKKYFKIWILLKNKENDIIKNIQQKLLNIIQNKELFKSRILHTKILLWIKKVNNLKKLDISLKKIINRNNKKLMMILYFYLNRWLYMATFIKIKNNGIIITRFCKSKINDLINQNQWTNFTQRLKNNNNKINIINIIEKLKYFKVIYKLVLLTKEIIIKNTFKQFLKFYKIKIFLYKIKMILQKINNKRNILLLKKNIVIWKIKKDRMILKDNKLKNLMDIMKLYSTRNAIYFINKSFDVKNKVNIIKKIGIILQKKNNINQNNLINLKKDFINSLNNSYKLQILNSLFNLYNKIIKRKIFINMNKFFYFLKYYYIFNKDIEYNIFKYKEESTIKKINLPLKFSNNNNKFNNINYDKKIYLIFILYFISFINKKKINIKIQILNKLKQLSYTKFKNKEIKYINSFYLFLRKLIIHKIIKVFKKIGYFIQLLYIIKITITHKNIAKNQCLLKIIKKWRFLSFIKIIFTKKMSIMYNNLHSGYIDLVNNIVDDDPLTKSQIDKMSRLDIKQYLNNFEDPLIIKNNEFKKENKNKFITQELNKGNKKNNENALDKNKDIFIDSSNEFNIENSMEKDISFMEKKFIKDNVNYLYNSYEDS